MVFPLVCDSVCGVCGGLWWFMVVFVGFVVVYGVL